MTQIAFWTSNWAEHHTGVLRTKVGQFGVTEGEYTIVIIHLLSGFYGQNMWKVSLYDLLPEVISNLRYLHPILNYVLTEQIGPVIVYIFAISISNTILYMIFNTLRICKHRRRALGEFISIILLALM